MASFRENEKKFMSEATNVRRVLDSFDPNARRTWKPVVVNVARKHFNYTWSVIAKGVGYSSYQTAANNYKQNMDSIDEIEFSEVLNRFNSLMSQT